MASTFPTVENCPQLILGAPSNVNSQDAVAAFARASKRIKSGENSRFSIEDLTSALSAIEATLRSNESGLKFSVPADPILFDKTKSFEFGGEVFRFDSDLSKFNIEQLDSSMKGSVGQVYLTAAIHQLLLWNWSEASEYARACLRLSDREDERDEALNVIAASLAAQGDDARALDALKKAVEGHWNLALQANLALIAVEIDPDLAIEHISYLVNGARTASEKIRACSTAIGIWTTSQSEQTGSSDQDNFKPLPRPFLNSIQSIVKSPDISEETFYEYGKFLARVDADELQKSGTISKSVHSQSPSAEVIRSRIRGLGYYLEDLVRITARNSSTDIPWLNEEVNGFVRNINANLFQENPEHVHFNLGFSFLKNGLDCSTRERILLRGILILKLSKFLEKDAQPSDKFIEWLSSAQAEVRKFDSNVVLDKEDKETLLNFLLEAGNSLTALIADSIITQGRKLQPEVQSIQHQMTGFLNRIGANRADISNKSRSIVGWCSEATRTLDNAERLIEDKKLKDNLKPVYSSISILKNSIIQYI
jgi:hypothetical protein